MLVENKFYICSSSVFGDIPGVDKNMDRTFNYQ